MIIGFAGKMQVGKDTAADALVDRGWKKLAFADHLKRNVMTLFDMTHDQMYTWEGKQTEDPRYDMSPRQILQWFGTDVIRENFPDLWVQHMDKAIQPHTHVTICDIRFDNEAQFVLDNGGLVFEIQRPSLEPQGWFRKLWHYVMKPVGHRSEKPISRHLVDFIIINDGSIKQLHQTVLNMKDKANWPRGSKIKSKQ